MNYKSTPLVMFLFILVLFLISIYFIYNVGKTEGFISYNQNIPTLNQLYISQYSKSNLVYKLFDSIYFDSINGNIIELFGQQYSTACKRNHKQTTNIVDTTGSSLTDIVLISRPVVSNSNMTIRYYNNSPTSNVMVDNSIIEDKITNSFIYGIIPNESILHSNENISYNYQVLYVAWGKDTIVHLYDCSPMKNVNIGTFLFIKGYDPMQYLYKGNLTSPLGVYIPDVNMDNKNNSFQPEILYDANKQTSLFQLTSHVLFDTTCRYLIVRKSNSISVYDGTFDSDGISPKMIYTDIQTTGVIKKTPDSIDTNLTTGFRVLYILDREGSNLILYIAIPSTKKTMIAILSVSSSVPGHLMLKNVKTFNQDSTNSSGLDGFDIVKKANTIQPTAIPNQQTATLNQQTATPNQQSLQGTNYIQNTNDSVDTRDETDYSIPSLDSFIIIYYNTI